MDILRLPKDRPEFNSLPAVSEIFKPSANSIELSLTRRMVTYNNNCLKEG